MESRIRRHLETAASDPRLHHKCNVGQQIGVTERYTVYIVQRKYLQIVESRIRRHLEKAASDLGSHHKCNVETINWRDRKIYRIFSKRNSNRSRCIYRIHFQNLRSCKLPSSLTYICIFFQSPAISKTTDPIGRRVVGYMTWIQSVCNPFCCRGKPYTGSTNKVDIDQQRNLAEQKLFCLQK